MVGLILRRIAFGVGLLLLATQVQAQGANRIGVSSAFNNDYLGDGEDRWQTASYWRSWVNRTDTDAFGTEIGSLREYRLRGQIVTPQRLSGATAAGERPYTGVLAFGAFARGQSGRWDHSVGLELGAYGPQTRMDEVHIGLHAMLAENEPKGWDSQLEDEVWLGPTAELGYSWRDRRQDFVLRPFFGAQATDETLVRLGLDLSFGINALGLRSVRDPVSGHRMPVRDGKGARGLRVDLGYDVAYVDGSRMLQGHSMVDAEPVRRRARAAMLFPLGFVDFTYGLTYLSPEFRGQASGQTIGTIGINLRL